MRPRAVFSPIAPTDSRRGRRLTAPPWPAAAIVPVAAATAAIATAAISATVGASKVLAEALRRMRRIEVHHLTRSRILVRPRTAARYSALAQHVISEIASSDTF